MPLNKNTLNYATKPIIDDDFMLCSKTIEGLQIDLKLVFDNVN